MKEKASVSRKEQAVLTKKKIFDTTMLLIRKKSYSKITIREICQNAEISVGTFYLYFLSKDDILLELYYKMEAEFVPELPAASPFPASVLSLAGQFLSHLHTSFARDLLQEVYRINLSCTEDAFPRLHGSAKELPFPAALLTLLLQAKEARELVFAGDCRLLRERLLIFLNGHLFHWLCSEGLDFEGMQAQCLEELSHYMSFYIEEKPLL